MSVVVRSNKKKFIALFFVTAVIATVIILSTFARTKSRAGYITATGVMEATEVTLSPKAFGKLEWLCCKEGDSVTKGQAVLRLDSRELKAKVDEARAVLSGAGESLKEVTAVLESAKAAEQSAGFEVEASVAEVDRIKSLVNDSKENFERAKVLLKDGYISRKDYDSAETAFNANAALLTSSKARKRSADGALSIAGANIKVARARISTAEAKKTQAEAQLKVLSAQLEDAEVFSPIDGVVVNKSFEVGENAPAGAPVYTVFDLKNIWARVDIEETDASKIRLGGPVKITAPGLSGREFDAKVIEVGSVAAFATQKDVTRGRKDIKSFRVKAGVSNADGFLKPGMTVDVSFFIGDNNSLVKP